MINFLFWNVKGPGLDAGEERYQLLHRLLTEVVRARTVDILILAESPFAGLLSVPGLAQVETLVPANRSTGCRLEIYHRETVRLLPLRGVGRCSIQKVTVVASKKSLLLAALHLQAPPRPGEETRRRNVENLVKDILSVEEEQSQDQTLVVGDFNYDPFDLPIIDAIGFNAVAAKREVSRGKRSVKPNDRPYLYNPMWSHFGDANGGPPGTYYWDKESETDCRFWYLPDQVLLRPSLLPHWQDRNLKILGKIGRTNLIDSQLRPDAKRISDHLPLLFRLDL